MSFSVFSHRVRRQRMEKSAVKKNARNRAYRERKKKEVTNVTNVSNDLGEGNEQSLTLVNIEVKSIGKEYKDLALPLVKDNEAPDSICVTPERKHTPSFRQRCHSAQKKLSKNPEIRAAQGISVFLRVLKSPSTKMQAEKQSKNNPKLLNAAKFVIAQSEQQNEIEHRELFRQVRQIATFKSKKQCHKIRPIVTSIKRKYSLRAAAKITKVAYSQLHWMSKPTKSKSKRKITKEQCEIARKFFNRTEHSMQLPYKRFAHFRYHRSAMDHTYKLYRAEQRRLGNRVLSKSSLRRILGKHFKASKLVPYKECMCSTCLNYGLKIDSLLGRGIKGIDKKATVNIMRTMCEPAKPKPSEIVIPVCRSFENRDKLRNDVLFRNVKRRLKVEEEKIFYNPKLEKRKALRKAQYAASNANSNAELGITDCDRKCIFRECKLCGKHLLMTHIMQQNLDLDLNATASYYKWTSTYEEKKEEGETVKKRTDFSKQLIKTTVGELLAALCADTSKMSSHLFNFKWQAAQFENCKANLKRGDIVMVMDFAQNVAHRMTMEAQSAHWHRKQTTLHPVVCYYRCPCCEHLVHDEVLCITEDLKHDAGAVEAFVKETVEHLKDLRVPIKRVFQWSDNASSQYKCSAAFDLLSMWDIPIQRHYYGAQHGKGAADSCIGRVVREVAGAVRTEKEEIFDGLDFFLFVQTKTTIRPDRKSCLHYRRHFKYIHRIPRAHRIETKTIKGTQKIHCIRNTGNNHVLDHKVSSCLCR